MYKFFAHNQTDLEIDCESSLQRLDQRSTHKDHRSKHILLTGFDAGHAARVLHAALEAVLVVVVVVVVRRVGCHLKAGDGRQRRELYYTESMNF